MGMLSRPPVAMPLRGDRTGLDSPTDEQRHRTDVRLATIAIIAAVVIGIFTAVLAGCSAGTQPVVPPTATTAHTSAPSPSVTSTEPAPSSFTPDEAGFVAAVAKGDPTWKWPTEQLLIDTGYNICSLKESSPDVAIQLFPEPQRQKVYLDAATTYLCP